MTVSSQLDTVKRYPVTQMTATATEQPYHHGDLPAALRAAAAELVAERGANRFSLREAARRAGVSHAAPAHHFGNASGLLTAVATEGFELLADELEAAAVGIDDAAERLERCGQAYVRAALARPGHYAVMLDSGLIEQDDLAFTVASSRAYAALQNTIGAVRAQLNPELDVKSAAALAWAAMHGLVELSPQLKRVAGSSRSSWPLDAMVSRFTPLLIEGFRTRPPASG